MSAERTTDGVRIRYGNLFWDVSVDDYRVLYTAGCNSYTWEKIYKGGMHGLMSNTSIVNWMVYHDHGPLRVADVLMLGVE